MNDEMPKVDVPLEVCIQLCEIQSELHGMMWDIYTPEVIAWIDDAPRGERQKRDDAVAEEIGKWLACHLRPSFVAHLLSEFADNRITSKFGIEEWKPERRKQEA
jgi:hypothetical protein